MDLRTKSILEAAIQEFINSGAPVSSKELAKKYKFGVKDATVRSELNRLTKDGFLSQPHTSGGRIPTDKGYQFYVQNAIQGAAVTKKILSGKYGTLAGELHHGKLKDFVNSMSHETRLLGVGARERAGDIYKTGLDELINRLDMNTKQELCEVIRDFEMLDHRLETLRGRIREQLLAPQVFIGRESPITDSDNLSVILDSYRIDNDRFLVAIIGPKRMDYDRNVRLLKMLHEYDEEIE